jgi:hypothetical protein
VIATLGFEKNAIFFAENWQKIAEISNHNIDPQGDQIGRILAQWVIVCFGQLYNANFFT